MEIAIIRQRICMGDEMEDHSIRSQVNEQTKYSDRINCP